MNLLTLSGNSRKSEPTYKPETMIISGLMWSTIQNSFLLRIQIHFISSVAPDDPSNEHQEKNQPEDQV